MTSNVAKSTTFNSMRGQSHDVRRAPEKMSSMPIWPCTRLVFQGVGIQKHAPINENCMRARIERSPHQAELFCHRLASKLYVGMDNACDELVHIIELSCFATGWLV